MKRISFALLCLALAACSKKSAPEGGNPPGPVTPPVVTPVPLITLPAEWVKQTAVSAGFPAGIEVYRRTAAYANKAMNAWCVVFDPKDPTLELKPVLPATNKKVSTQYAEEPGTKYAAINAGYFGTNISYSLVQYNGTVSAVNIKSLTRTYNGSPTTYYPTRGAFGITAGGVPEVAWVYSVGAGNGTLYRYPQPSPNDVTQAPQPVPTAAFPAGGSVWQVQSAIGGSPVLVYNNQVRITDTEELIDINNGSSRARSAIGHTASGKVVLLAVEGNNPNGGAGLNLTEMASLMKEMGCTGALNLDGGGSTSLVVNGQPTVVPSDANNTTERAVMSTLILKRR